MLRFRGWVYALILVLAVAAVYGPFLWNPIVFDDLAFFMPGSDLLDNFTHSFSLFEIRWLPYATIAWTKRLFGIDLIWFRLGDLFLHALVGVALYFFLRRLYQQVMASSLAEADSQPWLVGAFIAALLFAIHPVAVYGAGYLIQRTIVMSTLFSLLALIAYLKGLEQDDRPWLWVSVAFYLLAVLSKEAAIMLPAIMLAITVVVAGTDRALIRRLWPIYLACFMVALYVLSQKMGMMGTAYEIDASRMLENAAEKTTSGVMVSAVTGNGEHYHLLSVFNQCAFFFKYLGLWIFPDPDWMSVDMREPFAGSLLSLYLLAVLGFLTYGGVALRLLFKRGSLGLIGLAMVFPWLLFFPEFSVIRIQESFVLYRSYLWMPGIFIALPLLMMQIKPRIAIISGTLLAVILSLVAVDRLTTFSHPLLLWDDAEKLVHERRDLPGIDRIYGNRGKYFGDVKRYPDAIADYKIALSLRPDNANYYLGMAFAYLNMEDYLTALATFSKSIELDSKRMRAYYGRGKANEGGGNKRAALADFEKSCEMGWQSGCIKAQQLKSQ
jgi:hypothetical protein